MSKKTVAYMISWQMPAQSSCREGTQVHAHHHSFTPGEAHRGIAVPGGDAAALELAGANTTNAQGLISNTRQARQVAVFAATHHTVRSTGNLQAAAQSLTRQAWAVRPTPPSWCRGNEKILLGTLRSTATGQQPPPHQGYAPLVWCSTVLCSYAPRI